MEQEFADVAERLLPMHLRVHVNMMIAGWVFLEYGAEAACEPSRDDDTDLGRQLVRELQEDPGQFLAQWIVVFLFGDMVRCMVKAVDDNDNGAQRRLAFQRIHDELLEMRLWVARSYRSTVICDPICNRTFDALVKRSKMTRDVDVYLLAAETFAVWGSEGEGSAQVPELLEVASDRVSNECFARPGIAGEQ